MNYENNFVYRLIQFLYVSIFILGIILVVYIGYQGKPHEVVSNQKSYLECTNGKTISFESANIFVFDKTQPLASYEDINARKACEYNIKDDYSNKYKTPALNYKAKVVSEIQGSWEDVIAWWFGGLVVIFFGLNIAKESLLYVFIGKKFSWNWLQKTNDWLK